MKKTILILGLTIGWGGLAQATTLENYLEQVKKQSLSYQATSEQAEGAKQISREADLIFTPKFFAEAESGHDGKLGSPAVMTYDRREYQNYSAGLSQQFSFGLETKLYYQLNQTEFKGANFGTGVADSFWDASPKIELTMPLWQNGFGRGARANETLTRQQSMSESFKSAAQSESFLLDAENAFWRLSAAQETIRIQNQAIAAAQEIYGYVSKLNSRNLGDKADVLQARALVEAYRLQVVQSQNELRAAQRNYNFYLNQNPNDAAPELSAISNETLLALQVPGARPGNRSDVQATESDLLVAKASKQLALERNRPSLNLYGGYALNGRADEQNPAIQDAERDYRDSSYVGVRFEMPLNFSAASKARAGAARAEKAAEMSRQHAFYSQEQDWTNLTQGLTEAKENLKLLVGIEEAQKAKLEHERRRLRLGRTTTYQVLLFEQDYNDAQISRVRAALEILKLNSQVKLYHVASTGVK